MSYMEKLYSVVATLATVIGMPGTSVLIFVPGMNDSKFDPVFSIFNGVADLIFHLANLQLWRSPT
jgi:hypothetical protein